MLWETPTVLPSLPTARCPPGTSRKGPRQDLKQAPVLPPSRGVVLSTEGSGATWLT